jgi:hypothetical protein
MVSFSNLWLFREWSDRVAANGIVIQCPSSCGVTEEARGDAHKFDRMDDLSLIFHISAAFGSVRYLERIMGIS